MNEKWWRGGEKAIWKAREGKKRVRRKSHKDEAIKEVKGEGRNRGMYM